MRAPDEIAGVDGGGGEAAGLARVRAVARPPDGAGLDAVGFGGEVAHLLEGVAPVAEIVRPVGQAFELDRLDLGAVLGAFERAHLGDDPVDGALDAPGLGVQHVDEAPQQALALVGELGAVRCDAADQRVDDLLDAGDRFLLGPDEAVVRLVGSGGRAVQRGQLAGGGRGEA